MINATNKNLDDLRGVVQLLWGVDVQEDTFRRWTQGLYVKQILYRICYLNLAVSVSHCV